MAMIEVRELGDADEVPGGADHVRIARAASGRYAANGVSGGDRDATFWTPAAFATFEEAMRAARDWATEHGVATVYVPVASER
jgi:hypothetical protein